MISLLPKLDFTTNILTIYYLLPFIKTKRCHLSGLHFRQLASLFFSEFNNKKDLLAELNETQTSKPKYLSK